MIEYTIDQLMRMVFANNGEAIHAALVAQGRIASTTPLASEAIGNTIQRKWEETPGAEYFDWLERLLDVPVKESSQYTLELQTIKLQYGQSPAKVLVDKMRKDNPGLSTKPASSFNNQSTDKPPIIFWVVITLATIGLFCSIGYFAKILRKLAA